MKRMEVDIQKTNRDCFSYNEKYLMKNDKPWFPIMGEMHYSRYPNQYWEESIEKMKAGGVDVLSTYILWIHHEEIEGEYDFSGNKNLKAFVETCKKCNTYMMLRIGPWCHAEVRNGGFPDWLLKKDFELRTNDEAYFETIYKFYSKIYEQVEGLLLKDGGPIIGVQIENEYGHCGGLNGPAGEIHMQRLTQMAKEIGFDVPIYTATGWGGAMTGGLLPVMGGYCEAPWDQRLTEIEPSGNYIFTHERNDHNIGSDYGFGEGITFDINKFPYLTAELGGGLQVTHHRRPIAHSKDIGAMSMVKLGSGVNLLGYYMYHGGTNPKGKLSFLQESKATGSINDLPELNYDFRAPIRAYGQVSETYKEIKLLTMFIKDFGSNLCEMPATIPESNPLHPNNLTDLRTSIRHNGKMGYVFVNNYQRRYQMAEHQDVALQVALENETITYPPIHVKNEDYFFYPFNMEIGEAVLKTAVATPLCRLDNEVKTYVFYSEQDPCYEVKGNMQQAELLTLTREEAKNAWKVQLDKEYLLVSNQTVLQRGKAVELVGQGKPRFKAYPALNYVPKDFVRKADEGTWAVYEKELTLHKAQVELELIEESKEKKVYQIKIENIDKACNDLFIDINYNGDCSKLYIEDEYVDDHFYTGEKWEIGLKRFDFPTELKIEIMPLEEEAKIFLEHWPEMEDGRACKISKVSATYEYRTIVSPEQ